MFTERTAIVTDLALVAMATAACAAIDVAGKLPAGRAWTTALAITASAYAASWLTRRRPQWWRVGSGAAATLAAAANGWHNAFEPSGAVAALDVLLLAAAGGALPALIAWNWQPRLARLEPVTGSVSTLRGYGACSVAPCSGRG